MRLRLVDRLPVDYQVLRDNYTWADHVLRVQVTGAVISWFSPATILDPACGDATIVAAAHRARPISASRLSDISAPSCEYVDRQMRAALPFKTDVACQSLWDTLAENRYYDLVVLTEILEHVDDPVAVLRAARQRAAKLVASSPMIADTGVVDTNPEHLWQFDASGYRDMLVEAGWDPITFVPVTLTPPQFIYDFQIWGAA